jgi:hypothetical protein
MRFRSRVDAWLVGLIVAADVAVMVSLFSVIRTGDAMAIAVSMLVLTLSTVLPIWILVATHYTFGPDELVIRGGPFVKRIPYADIRAVEPSRSLLSSPALSLDRLRLNLGAGHGVLVSPADKAGFLRELGRRRPGLGAD